MKKIFLFGIILLVILYIPGLVMASTGNDIITEAENYTGETITLDNSAFTTRVTPSDYPFGFTLNRSARVSVTRTSTDLDLILTITVGGSHFVDPCIFRRGESTKPLGYTKMSPGNQLSVHTWKKDELKNVKEIDVFFTMYTNLSQYIYGDIKC